LNERPDPPGAWPKLAILGSLVGLLAGILVACGVVMPEYTPAPGTAATAPASDATFATRDAALLPAFELPVRPEGYPYASFSPDGEWLATGSGDLVDADWKMTLRVTSTETGQEWIAEDRTEGGGTALLRTPMPLHWSRDGRFLYFSHNPFADGTISDLPEPFHGTDLWRLNLQNGQVVRLTSQVGHWLALSPDETTLAYLSGGDVLGLRDLESGRESRVTLTVASVYSAEKWVHNENLLWSPDGRRLAFTAIMGVGSPEAASAVVEVDRETSSPKVLVRKEGMWVPLAWPEPDYVLLGEERHSLWWLRRSTGEIVRAQE
jgi:Tol biopolymer transport system component